MSATTLILSLISSCHTLVPERNLGCLSHIGVIPAIIILALEFTLLNESISEI